MQGGNRGERALAVLMRQRQAPINYDESLGYALPLEEPGNGLVTTGAGGAPADAPRRRCRRSSTESEGWNVDNAAVV